MEHRLGRAVARPKFGVCGPEPGLGGNARSQTGRSYCCSFPAIDLQLNQILKIGLASDIRRDTCSMSVSIIRTSIQRLAFPHWARSRRLSIELFPIR